MFESSKTKERTKLNKIISIISSLLIIAGLGIFLYPTISSYFAKRSQVKVINDYEDAVAEIDEEVIEEEFAKAQQYNESLSGEPVHDPFVEGSGQGLPDNYTEVLNISGDGVMAYIEIPQISLYLPIYHGTSDEVLQKGVGHIETTSLPIGGNSTHAVLSAHTGLPNAELFTRIDELVVGDVFYIHVLNETLAYKVYEIKIILPEDIDELQITSGQDLVTLVTCTPYGINTHRLLVKAERTEYIEEETEFSRNEQTQDFDNSRYYIIGTSIGTMVLIVVILFILLKDKYYKKGKHSSRDK